MNYLYTILAGVLYALCFPKFSFGLILAWVWPLPLFAALEKAKNWRQAYRIAFIFHAVAYGIILYWIPITIWTYSNSAIAAIAGWLAATIFVGLSGGLFGLFSFPLLRQHFLVSRHSRESGNPGLDSHPRPSHVWLLMLGLPTAWVLIEFVRGSTNSLLGGFPWCLAGHAITGNLYLAQLAEIGGISLLSFLVLFVATSLWLAIKTKKPLSLGIGFIAIGLSLVWGIYRVNSLKAHLVPTTKVAILQGNIGQYEKWDTQKAEQIIQTYSKLSEKALTANAQLIIWPETAFPYVVKEPDLQNFPISHHSRPLSRHSGESRNPGLDARLRGHDEKGTALKNNTFHLIGAVAAKDDAMLNSAILFKGKVFQNLYSKVHLVPFGEYVPLRKILSPWINVLSQMGDILPGAGLIPLDMEGSKLGITICYESIFPEIARELKNQGAQILINLTNDGWYLDTAAPYQHFLMNRLRAIENRLPLVRSANTGISAIIDPLGNITSQTKLNEETVLMGAITRLTDNSSPLFSLLQKLFPWLCLLAFIAISIMNKIRRES